MIEKKIRIVKTVLENKELSIRKIANLSGIDYKSAYYLIKTLAKEGILNLKKHGNSCVVSLKKRLHPIVIIGEYKRREEILKNKTIKIIFNNLKKLNFQFIAILFGSFIKRKNYNDIDLLVICEKNREREIEESLSILPLNLHTNFFTYSEFIFMLKSKEFNVVNEALKHYVILIGIEDFCRLIENVE